MIFIAALFYFFTAHAAPQVCNEQLQSFPPGYGITTEDLKLIAKNLPLKVERLIEIQNFLNQAADLEYKNFFILIMSIGDKRSSKHFNELFSNYSDYYKLDDQTKKVYLKKIYIANRIFITLANISNKRSDSQRPLLQAALAADLGGAPENYLGPGMSPRALTIDQVHKLSLDMIKNPRDTIFRLFSVGRKVDLELKNTFKWISKLIEDFEQSAEELDARNLTSECLAKAMLETNLFKVDEYSFLIKSLQIRFTTELTEYKKAAQMIEKLNQPVEPVAIHKTIVEVQLAPPSPLNKKGERKKRMAERKLAEETEQLEQQKEFEALKKKQRKELKHKSPEFSLYYGPRPDSIFDKTKIDSSDNH